jgi:G3E family GTPase
MAPVVETLLPLTVIGGYLGAGKTTLVNHLLRHANGLRIAVLVNEFGALPIDADLIEAQDEKIISIAGGCVCCSYGNDLMMALIELTEMNPPPEHVILEASGVAIPSAIASSIGLLAQYSLDGVIVLADAETLRKLADDTYMGDTVRSQLKDTDLLILNKTDLIEKDALVNTHNWLAAECADTRIIETQHARLPLEVALGLAPSAPSQLPTASLHHGDLFKSISLTLDGSVDVIELASRLTQDEFGVIRAKGFAKDIGGMPYEIQIVGRRWTAVSIAAAPYFGIVCIGSKHRLRAELISNLIAEA